ncbi:hypothetical protein CTI12_AA585840 [Artemisia annua]|uniref:Uncharacterized protein n=1 Tax=Artemisia annua TaxID=35608 RepID=A0A2U1KN45_ARTAN|nr:hypothetical protein CTI12_AA585840 [Artemisia annua]
MLGYLLMRVWRLKWVRLGDEIGHKDLDAEGLGAALHGIRKNYVGIFVDAGLEAEMGLIQNCWDEIGVFKCYSWHVSIAGVVAADGTFTVSRSNKLNDDVAADGNPISVRKCSATKKDKDIGFTLEFSWDTVKGKVTDSIISIENGTKFENKVAIPQGLKFRLIQASFHWLKNETLCMQPKIVRSPLGPVYWDVSIAGVVVCMSWPFTVSRSNKLNDELVALKVIPFRKAVTRRRNRRIGLLKSSPWIP